MRRARSALALLWIGAAIASSELAVAAEPLEDDDALSDVDVVAAPAGDAATVGSPPPVGDSAATTPSPPPVDDVGATVTPPPSAAGDTRATDASTSPVDDAEESDDIPSPASDAGAAMSPPSAPGGSSPAASVPRTDATEPQLRWGRVPIAWRGTVSTSYSQTWADSAPAQRAWGKQAEFTGTSFVYAPWLAKLDGGLRVSQFDAYGAAPIDTRSFGGDLRLSLFPVSRFPFTASIANNTVAAGDVKSTVTSYSLSQAYKPRSENYSVSGQYGRDIFRSSDGVSDVFDRLSGGYAYIFRTETPQTFEANWNASQNRPSSGISRSNNFDARARHTASLYDDYGLIFDNETAYRQSRFAGDPSVPGTNTAVRFGFAQSKVDWEPFIDLPLQIRSAVSYTKAELTAGDFSSFFEDLGFETNTGYSFGRYLRLTLGLRADYIRTQEERKSIVTYIARADSGYGTGAGGLKEFDVLGYRYKLSYDANAGADASSDGDFSPFVGLTLVQSLTRNFDIGFGPAAPLLFDFSQSYGVVWRNDLQPRTLSNVLTLQWQGYNGPYMVGSKLVATDSTTYGVENAPWFQSLAWDNTARAQLSSASSVSAALNVSWSRQGVREGIGDELTDGTWLGNGQASVSYQNVRFLDVPRLRYYIDYSNFFSPGLLAGGFRSDLANTRVGQSLTQRLQYVVGLLSFSASHSVSYAQGSIAQALYFTVSRSLSGVL